MAKLSGFWYFRFGRKNIEISGKKPAKMISTFPVSVKMCAKVIPSKGKQILKPLSGYITEVEKNENWDLVGASRYADLNHWRTAPSCSFQGPTTRCANRIPLKNQLHMKELKSLNQGLFVCLFLRPNRKSQKPKKLAKVCWYDTVSLYFFRSGFEDPWITTPPPKKNVHFLRHRLLIPFGNVLLGGKLQIDVKNQSLTFLRAPSVWNLGVRI